jgi:hypothetical protein
LNLLKFTEIWGDVLPVTSFVFMWSWNLFHWLLFDWLIVGCWSIILFELSFVQVLIDRHLVHYLFESLLVLVVQLILRGLLLLGIHQVEPLAILVPR